MTILIPSYEPDQRLIALVRHLKAVCDAPILVVDDGSGENYREIFEAVRREGCTVLSHRINQGKGSALKTGFDYVRRNGGGEGVVCADSDGQHLPDDILRIAQAVREHPGRIVLGSRQFAGKVPLRSRFGNSVTRWVYATATGRPIQDTQTGLRGYSSNMLVWLCQVPGDRFEYEMNMLLEASQAGYDLVEVPIETVYLDENQSSHFRPLADSARIYLPFLKFCTSSGFAALLDFSLLIALQWMTANLLAAVIGARLISSLFNYTVNRRLVFATNRKGGTRKSLPRYFSLVAAILLMNYGILHVLYESIGVPLVPSKLLTEASLFLFSYWMQRKFVY